MQKLTFRGIEFSRAATDYLLQSFDPNAGEVERQEYSYYGLDGGGFGNMRYAIRTVTMSGEIMASTEDELYEKRRALVHTCDGKTVAPLSYTIGAKTYFSNCVADLPGFGERTAHHLRFSVDFQLIDFYWKAAAAETANFTEQITVTCGSRVECPYTITIVGTTEQRTATGQNLTVENVTTGQKIDLKYSITANEIITINTESYTFTSSKSGNILSSWQAASSPFDRLRPGANAITLTNSGGAVKASASIRYTPLHLGV